MTGHPTAPPILGRRMSCSPVPGAADPRGSGGASTKPSGELNTAATGQNMLDVARAYEELAAAAAELAEAVEREDGASTRRPRARTRRSA